MAVAPSLVATQWSHEHLTELRLAWIRGRDRVSTLICCCHRPEVTE